MTTITLEVTDDIATSIAATGHRLPEIIALGLNKLSPLPAQVYSYILFFLANAPTKEQLLQFNPTPEMQSRMQELLEKSQADSLTDVEQKELEEYERIEHLIVMLKARALPYLIK